jgi:hypothetical protein
MKASGRFVVRVAPALHAELRELAAQREISLNGLCSSLLSSGCRSSGESSPESPDTAAVTQGCRQAFGEPLVGVVLFGSLARGEATVTSDADLLLVLAPGTSIDRGLYHQWDKLDVSRQSLAGHPPSPQFVALPSHDKPPGGLWYEVALDGQILWDRHGVTARTLRALRFDMLAGVIERRLTHGHPYWVRRHA